MALTIVPTASGTFIARLGVCMPGQQPAPFARLANVKTRQASGAPAIVISPNTPDV